MTAAASQWTVRLEIGRWWRNSLSSGLAPLYMCPRATLGKNKTTWSLARSLPFPSLSLNTGRRGNFPTNILSKRVVVPGAHVCGEKSTESYNNSGSKGCMQKNCSICVCTIMFCDNFNPLKTTHPFHILYICNDVTRLTGCFWDRKKI